MKRSSVLLLILGLCLMAFMFYSEGSRKTIESLGDIRPLPVIAGLAFSGLSLCIRALKWNILIELSAGRRIAFRSFLPIYLFNVMVANVTPARSGEAAAPALFKRYLGVNLGSGFTVIIVDRLLELVALVIGMLAAVFYYRAIMPPDSIADRFITTALLVCVAIAVVAMTIIASKKVFMVVTSWGCNRPRSVFVRNLFTFFRKEGEAFYEGVRSIGGRLIVRRLAPLTLCAWICDIFAVSLLFGSVMDVRFADLAMTFFLAVGVALASFIPSGLGSVELTYVYFLKLRGYDAALAAGGMAVTRLGPLILIAGAGALSALILRRRTAAA